jgi:hypothetical protein
MAKQKFDGIVETVHYGGDGQVEWVRAYERRGATFSDHILVSRQDLIDKLKKGKRYLVGERKEFMGSTFETSDPLRVITRDGQEVLVVGDREADKDSLTGVPIF